jgi:PAS domain S-box-containing protein
MSDKAAKDQEQRSAEAEVESFKEERGPFVVAAETTRMPMVFTNAKEPDHPIIYANDAFLKLTGYDRDELLAQSFSFLLADPADRHAMEQVEVAFAGKEDCADIRYRHKDGSTFFATIFVNPVKDKSGKTYEHFLSLVDTTKHERAREHAAMLIDELNHRVKNILATVQSIVAQAVRNSPDPEVVRESIESRIAALSRSHDLLGREKWDGAGLHDLVDQALDPFGVAGGRTERFTVKGDNIRLTPKATLALGIAFHELATNAVKYGAFSNEAGTIAIEWAVEARENGRWLSLRWRERGGPAVAAPSRKGFGSRVIEEGLAHELGGEVSLDYLSAGIVCTIDVPVPQVMLDG